jgi:hypothetical protein
MDSMVRGSSFFFQRLLPTAVVMTALMAHADAPAGRYSITNGVVTDTATGLAWQQVTSSSGMGWTEARAYCSGVWRLPTMKELQTIVDETQSNPAIDTTAFEGSPPYHGAGGNFWSSSAVAGSESQLAWVVDFTDGTVSSNSVENGSISPNVRCVK